MTAVQELDFVIFDLLSVSDLVNLHFTEQVPTGFKYLLNNNNYLCQRLNRDKSYSCEKFQTEYLLHHGRVKPIDIFIKQFTRLGGAVQGSEKYVDDISELVYRAITQNNSQLVEYFMQEYTHNNKHNTKILPEIKYRFKNRITVEIFLVLYQFYAQQSPSYNTVTVFASMFNNYNSETQQKILQQIKTTPLYIKGLSSVIMI